MEATDKLVCKKLRHNFFIENKVYMVNKIVLKTDANGENFTGNIDRIQLIAEDGTSVEFRMNGKNDFNSFYDVENYFYSKKEALNQKLKKIIKIMKIKV